MNIDINEKLKDRLVVVTGGGRGLGRVYALSFARSGSRTIICDMNEEDMRETVESAGSEGLEVTSFKCDITNAEQVEDVFNSIKNDFGRIEILVNNAGITDPGGPIWETDISKWTSLININVIGQYLCIRNVIKGMKENRSGTIINITSGAGIKALPYMSAYVISKTAMIRLTEQIALESAEYGIKAFAVSPGVVNTDMTKNAYASEGWKKWMPWLEEKVKSGEAVPPEKVAKLILLLSSGAADELSGCLVSSTDDVEQLIKQQKNLDDESYLKLRICNG